MVYRIKKFKVKKLHNYNKEFDAVEEENARIREINDNIEEKNSKTEYMHYLRYSAVATILAFICFERFFDYSSIFSYDNVVFVVSLVVAYTLGLCIVRVLVNANEEEFVDKLDYVEPSECAVLSYILSCMPVLSIDLEVKNSNSKVGTAVINYTDHDDYQMRELVVQDVNVVRDDNINKVVFSCKENCIYMPNVTLSEFNKLQDGAVKKRRK